MDLDSILNKIYSFLVTYGIKVVGAIVIWIIGSWAIGKITNVFRKLMAKRNYDESVQSFLADLINWGLKILLVLVIMAQLGIETTSFAAVIAAAGLAIGLALQGSLANFAGGVLIMIFKPFKIGDFIQAQGESGTVREIDIFTTKLNTPDNKRVIIPNGTLSNGNITNYTEEDIRRVDLLAGVSYDADIKKTKEVLMDILTKHPMVLKDPAPVVNVIELADSSVNFNVRPWVKNADYWTVYSDVTEQMKLELDKAGIDIPYPHRVEIQKQG